MTNPNKGQKLEAIVKTMERGGWDFMGATRDKSFEWHITHEGKLYVYRKKGALELTICDLILNRKAMTAFEKGLLEAEEVKGGTFNLADAMSMYASQKEYLKSGGLDYLYKISVSK